ncbi:1438_t:CDS:2 [Paraglomus occultum]|uniref:1438_t:CDS:1 n=1 Tax=Paraglomus occultum TaxID=144539 RepID=A0A9N8VN12_9GLOM|nr:1438_t:CDS:2 [Paraglomus occultum]
MVNAQEWLNKSFPNKKEVNCIIRFGDQHLFGEFGEAEYLTLEGELKISDFPKLTTLIIGSENLTSIKFINCPNLVDVDVTSCPELKLIEFHNSGSQPICQLFTKIREKEWDRVWELRSEITESLEEEKRELQKDIFSLQEKSRLDGKEIKRLNKKNQILEKENQELSKQLEETKFETVDLEGKIEIKKKQLKRTKSDLERCFKEDNAPNEDEIPKNKKVPRPGGGRCPGEYCGAIFGEEENEDYNRKNLQSEIQKAIQEIEAGLQEEPVITSEELDADSPIGWKEELENVSGLADLNNKKEIILRIIKKRRTLKIQQQPLKIFLQQIIQQIKSELNKKPSLENHELNEPN